MSFDFAGEIPIAVEATLAVRTDTQHNESNGRIAEIDVISRVDVASIYERQDTIFEGKIHEVGEDLDELPNLDITEVFSSHVSTASTELRVEKDKREVAKVINESRRAFLNAGTIGGIILGAGAVSTLESFSQSYDMFQKVSSPIVIAVGALVYYFGRKTSDESSSFYEQPAVEELDRLRLHAEQAGVIKAVVKSAQKIQSDKLPEQS